MRMNRTISVSCKDCAQWRNFLKPSSPVSSSLTVLRRCISCSSYFVLFKVGVYVIFCIVYCMASILI